MKVRNEARPPAGRRALRLPSAAGLAAMLVMGALSATLVLFLWGFLVSVLSPFHVTRPLLPWGLGGGAVLGLLAGLSGRDVRRGGRGGRKRSRPGERSAPFRPALAGGLPALAGGLAVSLVWLAATGWRPFGLPGPSFVGLLGGVICFPLGALLARRALAGINPARPAPGTVELLAVRTLQGLGLVFFVLIVLFPFYFMIVSSMKSRAEYLRDPTDLSLNLSQGPAQVFVGYREVLTRFRFARYILNSTVVALATVVVTLVPAVLGGYAVTRLRFPGRELLSRSILLIYMFPAIVLVIPLYSVFTRIGLRNTLHGLLIVYAAMTIPVALYMLRSYFQTLPRDIEESGMIDGCTRAGVIWRITLPLSGPALSTVALYVFMIAWNEFLFAFMFLDAPEIYTLSRGMVALDTQEVPRQYLMSGAVIITVPVMVLFFWFEKYLVSGLTAGSVKG